MASGFITINENDTYSIRFTGFDIIIHSIIDVLNDTGREGKLKTFLLDTVPRKDLDVDDVREMGYGFVRERDDKPINRFIDIRWLNPTYQELFKSKAIEAHQLEVQKQRATSYMLECLEDFSQMAQRSLGHNGATSEPCEFTDEINALEIGRNRR